MSGSGGGSGLGDFGLLTGGTGQTSQTGFGSGGGGSGILQPTKPQSGLSMMGGNNNTSSVSTSGSLFSGMQTGGSGDFNPQTLSILERRVLSQLPPITTSHLLLWVATKGELHAVAIGGNG